MFSRYMLAFIRFATTTTKEKTTERQKSLHQQQDVAQVNVGRTKCHHQNVISVGLVKTHCKVT